MHFLLKEFLFLSGFFLESKNPIQIPYECPDRIPEVIPSKIHRIICDPKPDFEPSS